MSTNTVSRRPTRPVPIRLDDATRTRLRAAAIRLGSNSSCVIRLALLSKLPELEAGQITIPPVQSGV